MGPINDKDGVVRLLESLERVCREIKGLPDFVKRTMAVNAGCLETDLDELEDLVTQARECVEDDLVDTDDGEYYHRDELRDDGYIHESEINCKDNFEIVLDALGNLNRATSDEQIELVMKVLKTQDTITTATELSAILHDTRIDARAVSVETLETVLELLRTPFNAELADKLHGETNEA